MVRRVDSPLDKKLATFLKKKRGEMTFKAFSQKTGLPPSTLFRLEQGTQSITLGKLDLLMTRLKCGFSDIFETRK
jgi:transcriptional regulator with XRE-family HTH domain